MRRFPFFCVYVKWCPYWLLTFHLLGGKPSFGTNRWFLFFFRFYFFFFYFMFYSAQLEALVREGGHGLLLAWTQMNLICPGHWLDSCQCPTGSSLVTGLSFDLGEKSIGREMSYQDFPHTPSHADENYTDVCQQAHLRTEKSPIKPKLDR